MKTQLWVLFLCLLMILLTSCAANQTGNDVRKLAPATATQEREILEKHVTEKVRASPLDMLRAMNDFHDTWLEVMYAKGKKIVVLAVEKTGFPFYFEHILRSNSLLNSLPRDKKLFTFVESKRAPGVINVYYKVHADYIPEGKQQPLNWMPSKEIWGKFVEAKENLLTKKTPEEMFLTLFYMGNIDFNPELILAVKGADNTWDWDRMPHPSKTGIRQAMLIPIATMQNQAMFDLLKQ